MMRVPGLSVGVVSTALLITAAALGGCIRRAEKPVGAPPAGIYDAIFPELGIDILRLRNRYQRRARRQGGDNIDRPDPFTVSATRPGVGPAERSLVSMSGKLI